MQKEDYCQYLTIAQGNYTLTNLADHKEGLSHDRVNRFLRDAKLKPSMIWHKAKEDVLESENGYVLFDDTVIDKNHSHKIELVKRQYSGNAGGLIKGIGVVTCVYVNPEKERYWIIDMRIYAPEEDGKSKIDHVEDMIRHTMEHKKLFFRTILMDSWYAVKPLLLLCESYDKIYYCPIKKNRKVDDSGGVNPYKAVERLEWDKTSLESGKRIKMHKYPKNHKVRLFRVPVSTRRTDFVITNDPDASISTDDVRKTCAIRWKIEQLHREGKQLTGLEKCQCRIGRIQRNHIVCAWLVWLNLAKQAAIDGCSMYALKTGLLDGYLVQQLANPTLVFA